MDNENLKETAHNVVSGLILFVVGLLTKQGKIRVSEQPAVVAQGMLVVDSFSEAWHIMHFFQKFAQEKNDIVLRMRQYIENGSEEAAPYIPLPEQVDNYVHRFEELVVVLKDWLEDSQVVQQLRNELLEGLDVYLGLIKQIDVSRLIEDQKKIKAKFEEQQSRFLNNWKEFTQHVQEEAKRKATQEQKETNG